MVQARALDGEEGFDSFPLVERQSHEIVGQAGAEGLCHGGLVLGGTTQDRLTGDFYLLTKQPLRGRVFTAVTIRK